MKITATKEYVILDFFRRATGCKYIRLQSLCQVKIEVKKNHFLKTKIHLTRRTLLIYQLHLFFYMNISVSLISFQRQCEFLICNPDENLDNSSNTIQFKKVLEFKSPIHFLKQSILKNIEKTKKDRNF